MLDPSNRFATIVLAAGAVVLVVAIAIGEHMGDRVLGQATEHALESIGPISASPDPNASSGAYGPDWKRSETLAAAADPRFPDPRIPPQPLPTPLPAPRTVAVPLPATATPNPNIPVWRQVPMPTPTPTPTESPPPGPSVSPSPVAESTATATPQP